MATNEQNTGARVERVTPAASEEMEIDLVELLYRLLEKVKYIILAAVLGALIAGVYTFRFVTPTYQSTSKLYVLSTSDSVINLSDLQLGSNLANDYIEVFSNWHVHEMVIQRLGLDYTYTEIQNMVSVQNKSSTRILYITCTSTDPQEAKDLADAYADVAREFISVKMGTDKPTVFEEARVPTRPSSPNRTRNILLGFILGALLAAAVIVVQFIADDRIRTLDSVEKKLGVPALGMMPVQAHDLTEDGKMRSKKGGRSK